MTFEWDFFVGGGGDYMKFVKDYLKCCYDEIMLFSVDSDFIFGKNAPCQLLHLNFKSKSEFFN